MNYQIFGESHGPAIGVVLTNVPAGIELDTEFIGAMMKRRAPGQNSLSTPRKEADVPEILSGVFEGKTSGAPLCAVINNSDTHSSDYDEIRRKPRPSHSDYAASVRYEGFNDYRGGGHFSGRLTAPLVFAGSIAMLDLKNHDVSIYSEIVNIGGIEFPDEETINSVISDASNQKDSVGGVIRCTVTGFPAGFGSPDYGENIEGELARAVFAIPAVKGISFGSGFGFASMKGSKANDPFRVIDGNIRTSTNHAGGINGGISNGEPIIFDVVFRPTPSIGIEQETVDIQSMENTTLTIKGRHDPCIVLRARPVVESAAALTMQRMLRESR